MPPPFPNSPSAFTFTALFLLRLALCISASPLRGLPTANTLPKRDLLTDGFVNPLLDDTLVDSTTPGGAVSSDGLPTLKSPLKDLHSKNHNASSPPGGILASITIPSNPHLKNPPSSKIVDPPTPGVVPISDDHSHVETLVRDGASEGVGLVASSVRPPSLTSTMKLDSEASQLFPRETVGPNGRILEQTVICHHDMPLLNDYFYHNVMKRQPKNDVSLLWGAERQVREIHPGQSSLLCLNSKVGADVIFFVTDKASAARNMRPFAEEYKEVDGILERVCGSRVLGSVGLGDVLGGGGEGGEYSRIWARYGRFLDLDGSIADTTGEIPFHYDPLRKYIVDW